MHDLYTRVSEPSCFEINKIILKSFESLTDGDFKEKTHLFNGRYENLYLEIDTIPALKVIVNAAIENASKILKVKRDQLKSGFWLNEMKPGDVTTAHTHDDTDEILSCVYYVKVPENSGDLILIHNNEKTVIKPEEGVFVYFSPDTLHEVTKNESSTSRLSIAFNFGVKQEQED